MNESKHCEAIVAHFTFGPMRCMQPSTTEAIDATWGSIHPVCALHAPDDASPAAARPDTPTNGAQ